MIESIAEMTAKSHCREAFSSLQKPGMLRAERFWDEVRITYVASAYCIDERDSTYLNLSWRGELRELWICQLRVASSFRNQGLGKRLVAASEQLARRLGARSVNVFPLQRARTFWLDAGYRPDRNVSRVLTKLFAPDT